MDGYKLGVVETRFAELIWQHEPLTSGELVKLCEHNKDTDVCIRSSNCPDCLIAHG